MCLNYFDWAPLFCDSIQIFSSLCLCLSIKSEKSSSQVKCLSKMITLHCFGQYFKDEYLIWDDCWDCQLTCPSSLFKQFVPFPLSHTSTLSFYPRNACGSTRMQPSGLPSSGSCVRLIRAWKTCSTMGFSSQPAMGGMASSWTKSESFESTPSQSARVSRLWR